jgi:Na+-translocating ferredoxin:NAD+ oxidoreductase RnfC subunit
VGSGGFDGKWVIDGRATQVRKLGVTCPAFLHAVRLAAMALAAALSQPAGHLLMAKKRSPQTAAKRAREQAMREKRERKQAKKRARLDGTAPPPPPDEPAEPEQQ